MKGEIDCIHCGEGLGVRSIIECKITCLECNRKNIHDECLGKCPYWLPKHYSLSDNVF